MTNQPVTEGVGNKTLVDPVVFGSHLHYVIYKRNEDGSITKTMGINGRVIPVVEWAPRICMTCMAEDKAFDSWVADIGAHAVAKRINRREQYRLYDRKYPYDSTTKATSLESVQDTMGVESDYESMMVADELVAAFKSSLTPLQRWMLGLFEQGYHPRDVAVMRGKSQSKSESERWHKNSIKKKLIAFYEERG